MFRPLKVTFVLDGTGIYYHPEDPIHLDALLAFCASVHHKRNQITRGDIPDDFPIPCAKWRAGRTWGWRCSALFPEGPTAESIEFLRKKFRQDRADLTTGSPNLSSETYREYNIPMTLTLATKMTAYCVGERRAILRELRRNIRHLGCKRSAGRGRVSDIIVEEWPDDWSVIRNGRAMRYLPCPGAARICRPRPPYWNPHGAIRVCDPGDPVDISIFTDTNDSGGNDTGGNG